MKRKVFIGLLALTLCAGIVACERKKEVSETDTASSETSDTSNTAAEIPEDIEPIEFQTSPNDIQVDADADYTAYEDLKTIEDVSSNDTTYNWINKNKAAITENNVSSIKSESEAILESYDFTSTESTEGSESEIYKVSENDYIMHQTFDAENLTSIVISDVDGGLEFDYLGVTQDSKIGDVVSLFGEPVSVSVVPDTQMTTYVYVDESKETTMIFNFVGSDDTTSKLTYMSVYSKTN